MLSMSQLTPKSILDKIREIYKENYQDDNIDIVEEVLNDVLDLFYGKRKGFLKCDTKYHDLLHTLQVIPPFIGIIDGWNKSGNPPKISKESFDLGIIAVLLHDTGYIKTEDDIDGTGGKYTFVHIQRSTNFASHYLSQLRVKENKIYGIKNIVACTGVKVDLQKVPFNSEEERIIGYTLGTADLLGQMSTPDYPEKLSALYNEFEEAYRFEGEEKLEEMDIAMFESAEDLIKKTPFFYEVIVKARFETMGSMHKYLVHHFKDSRNYYIEAIEENIKKINLAFLS